MLIGLLEIDNTSFLAKYKQETNSNYFSLIDWETFGLDAPLLVRLLDYLPQKVKIHSKQHYQYAVSGNGVFKGNSLFFSPIASLSPKKYILIQCPFLKSTGLQFKCTLLNDPEKGRIEIRLNSFCQGKE